MDAGYKIFYGIALAITLVCVFGLIGVAANGSARMNRQAEELERTYAERDAKWEAAINDEDTQYWIDGEPVSADFNPKAVSPDKYTVRFEGDDVYLETIHDTSSDTRSSGSTILFLPMFR